LIIFYSCKFNFNYKLTEKSVLEKQGATGKGTMYNLNWVHKGVKGALKGH